MKNNKKNIGTWITTFNHHTLDVIAHSGFNWLCIDMEHSDISDKELNLLIAMAKKNKITPYVRLASKTEENFKKALDFGAAGLIVPMVETKKDVDDIIKFSHYAPIGKRSFGLYSHNNFGLKKNYLKTKNYKPKIILQIESKKAIDNLDTILSSKHIYGTLIGRYDLSLTLNSPGNFSNKSFQNHLSKYLKICKKKKIKTGIHIADFEISNINSEIKNYDIVAIGADFIFLKKMCELLIRKIK